MIGVDDQQQERARNWNIAARLSESARQFPHERAVVFPTGFSGLNRLAYTQLSFSQLEEESNRLSRGLIAMGVQPGTRLVLMVRPSLEFITLTFALFKAGATVVLIDPGMGRSNIFRCLEEVEPEGFVAIPVVQLIRRLNARRFPQARLNVCVGGPAKLLGCRSYQSLLAEENSSDSTIQRAATDPAAIIFTSGSTGPPKGVLYEHGMFNAQVDLLQEFYSIQPGEIDLPGFPLFALFNTAMGVTTVIPKMDPTKPAQVDPKVITQMIKDQGVTQAFGSPAMWNRIGRYCEQHEIKLPSLKRILSAGAPVPGHVIRRMRSVFCSPDADIFTPYGATESLPVASISGAEVMGETAKQTAIGAGTCVGRPFPQMTVRIIPITEGPLQSIEESESLPAGEIGEIIVQGPPVTREYFRRNDATRAAKIPDGEKFWHRIGDVGYFDDSGRLWFCGRKAHMLETAHGRMFTVPCEAIFNEHPEIYRSALVGVGTKPGQRPVLIAEPEAGHFPNNPQEKARLERKLLDLAGANNLTETIETILFHRSLPVDIRHNVKIFREKLVPWAEQELSGR